MNSIEIRVDGKTWLRQTSQEKEPTAQIEEMAALLREVREYCVFSIMGLLPDGEGSES